MQMSRDREADKADFDALGITVLPIVMNTKSDITADMDRYGVTTPFLLDDGSVSRAYGTLGKGMHADLPGPQLRPHRRRRRPALVRRVPVHVAGAERPPGRNQDPSGLTEANGRRSR